MLKTSIRLLFFSFFLASSFASPMMKTFAQRVASISRKAAINGVLKRACDQRRLHPKLNNAFGKTLKPMVCMQTLAQKAKINLTPNPLKKRIPEQQRPLQSMRDYVQEYYKNKRDHYHNQFNAYTRYGSVFIGSGIALTILNEQEEKRSAKQRYRYDKACREKARNNYYTYLKLLPWGSLAKKYIEEFQQEEKKLMEEFFQFAGISQTEFEYLEAECYQDFIESEKENNEQLPLLNDRFAQSMRQGLIFLGIDGMFLDIRSQRDDTFIAAAGIKTLYVNPDCVPKDAYGYKYTHTLYHELMHILHEDSLKSSVINKWINNPGFSRLRAKRLLFIERRADILASLLNAQVAYEAALARKDDFKVESMEGIAGQVRFAYRCKVYNEMMQIIRK